MFRYNRGSNEKFENKETGLVDGWRESQLIKSLNGRERKFNIQLRNGLIVEIDIHFFESFMRSLNFSGYMESGVPKDPMDTKTDSINIKSLKEMIEYLKNHHDNSTYKLPQGSLDLLMLIISNGDRMYKEIKEYEDGNKSLIRKLTSEKIENTKKALELENQKALENKTDKMQEQILKIETHYLDIIEIARANKKEGVAANMENKVMPNKIAEVLDKYGDSVLTINDSTSKKLKQIEKNTHLTYAFFISEFDILVAKVGSKKLRLRTIYDIYAPQAPKNSLLYIPDYGDKRQIPKF